MKIVEHLHQINQSRRYINNSLTLSNAYSDAKKPSAPVGVRDSLMSGFAS